ncbi:MAG: hypothetical protein U5S82_16725 [Gammaproteobacteria bacterium]|nr:hypothetical protein [Gammaproteobacteria bacterium]
MTYRMCEILAISIFLAPIGTRADVYGENAKIIKSELKASFGTTPFVTSWYSAIEEIKVTGTNAEVITNTERDSTPRQTKRAICMAARSETIFNRKLKGQGIKEVYIKDKSGTTMAIGNLAGCAP